MRALYVIHNPGWGGGYNQIVRLRRPLEALGWEVALAAPSGSEGAARSRAEGVEVFELPLHRLRASPDPRLLASFVARALPETRALGRLIRDWNADVVQPHGDTNPHAALAGRRAGRAVVWELYDTRTPVPLRRVTMPVVTRTADVVMTVGRALGLAYPGTAALGPRWFEIWPPVPDWMFAFDGDVRAAARAELGVPADAVVVGSIGLISPNKGFDVLLRGLAAARARGAPVVARVLGPPSPGHPRHEASLRREALALGLDDLAFDLRDGGTRIPDLLPAFDVLALTSRSEGLPTVILEAMTAGLPVVATDVGAVGEAVLDAETGYVVGPGDADAVADRLVRLANSADLRRRLGDAGRERFRERFGLDRLAARYADAYQCALERSAARQ